MIQVLVYAVFGMNFGRSWRPEVLVARHHGGQSGWLCLWQDELRWRTRAVGGWKDEMLVGALLFLINSPFIIARGEME